MFNSKPASTTITKLLTFPHPLSIEPHAHRRAKNLEVGERKLTIASFLLWNVLQGRNISPFPFLSTQTIRLIVSLCVPWLDAYGPLYNIFLSANRFLSLLIYDHKQWRLRSRRNQYSFSLFRAWFGVLACWDGFRSIFLSVFKTGGIFG